MDIISSIVLGVVEGLTEFLPVSSTGHLILMSEWLALPTSDFLKSFEVIIQLGAIGAVVALYWRRLLLDRVIFGRVTAAFLPTAILGLIFYQVIKNYLLESVMVVLWSLLLGGVVLIVFELYHKSRRREARLPAGEDSGVREISYRQAVIIGLCQAVAMIPGVSRSGATIVGGLALGLSRQTIVEFSFLLAVPTMLAATGWDLLQTGTRFSTEEFGLLLVGFTVSFLVALLAVKTFLRFIQQHNFVWFGVYRILLALIFAWWFF